MKRLLAKTALMIMISVGINQTFAQMDGSNAFILGDYVEIGINTNGYEGAICPDGDTIHCRGGAGTFGTLGFTANPLMDDWENYNGDYYSAGAPENGFGLEFDHLGTNYTFGNNAFGIAEISGSISSYSATTDSINVVWDGMVMDLAVTVKYTLKKDEHFYTTSMFINNTGLADYTNVYYYRSFDPDNNQSLSGNYSTTNTIESQSEMTNDSVIVSAAQSGTFPAEVILHAHGANWKGFRGGFSNRDGSDMWNGEGGLTGIEGSSLYGDQAFGVAYKIETLPPGGKVPSEWFSFVTAFKRGIVFKKEDEPATDGTSVNTIDFRIYPNPTVDKTVTVKMFGAFNYLISDINGRLILADSGNNTKLINLNSIENGIYFITLNQEEKSSTQKLIIQ